MAYHPEHKGFVTHSVVSSDGLRLHVRDYMPSDDLQAGRLPVICLPGLSRNSRDFHQLAEWLSSETERNRRVLGFDYRGRGQSGWDPDPTRYQLPVEAQDVITTCAALEIEEAIFIGTSRGGLILHLLASMKPALLRGIVLNDIGPVIETAGLVEIRHYLEAAPVYTLWRDVVEGLKRLYGQAFPVLSETDWNDMAQAIFVEVNGKIIPDFDPTLVQQLSGITPETILPDLWPLFDALRAVPAMCIRGEHSRILSEGTFQEMGDRHPAMRLITAYGQGHAPLLQTPALRGQIQDFLDQID